MKGFVMVKENELKKCDKRALATLYLYWLENGKKNTFDLPLFVDDNGKGVMSVEAFKRVFYAFQLKAKIGYNAEIKSGSDGDESNYNVVRLSRVAIPFESEDDMVYFCEPLYEAPKTKDLKRESSQKTKAKAEAKKEAKAKAEAEAEAENNKAWNNKACKKLLDVFQKYGVRLNAENMVKLEADILKVLETTI